MEEKPPSPAAANATPADQSMEEAALEKKRQAMIDRLSNRHQSRSISKPLEDNNNIVASFSSKFADSKHSLETLLAKSSSLAHDPSALRSHLDGISSSISSLEQFVAESSYSLPSYELRSALKSVAELKQSLETQSAELLPKKKFSFRNKSATGNNKFSAPVQPPEIPSPSPLPAFMIRESPGFRNREKETLTKNFKGLEIGEFTVSELDSCEVRLTGCVNALFFNKLKNCKVYTGPVIGSVLIEEVEDCVFVLASHQIRIHNAKSCDFYLRVRSRPIIEDCSEVRFAPYCLRYDGIDEELKEAGLEEESGKWANVDDFKWLKNLQSPNWSVMEESERIGCVEIKELGNGNGNNGCRTE
ncbi:Tubulin-folding cofactor C [Linum grandiflorum]